MDVQSSFQFKPTVNISVAFQVTNAEHVFLPYSINRLIK